MKINKQEFFDNMDKLMEKLEKDEVFAKALAEKQTSAEAAAFLLDNGISISADAIDAVTKALKEDFPELAKFELSEDELEAVAAGSAGEYFKAAFYGATHPVSTLVRVWTKKGQDKIYDDFKKWDPLTCFDSKFSI